MDINRYKQELPVGEIADEVNCLLLTHPRLIVTAPPGAGKSTLLPLTLLERTAGGKVVVLEPRRLAARQVAERMAFMLGEPVGRTVGYRMRLESRVSEATRVEVVTEGILTRMLVDDTMLEGVDVVVFDEFHERSLASDVALAMIREVQNVLRPDLRLVVMSATIDATTLCKALNAPLVESRGRMFDVEIVYGSEADAPHCAEQVAQAVGRLHRQYEGDILAFLPGQAEILRCKELLGESLGSTEVYPLYGMLSMQEQQRALASSPSGYRKVVLATPVAETSLTIEGIRIVVDSGFCRKPVFDLHSALSRMETVRISRDMATQRSGRAGRVAQGICYRLWSKATDLRMEECRRPEVVEADLAPMLLDIAAWGGGKVEELPWITPPQQAHVQQGRQLLTLLGALDAQGCLTPHGRELARIPCHPRLAQMLLKARTAEQKALAADLAALFEDRDPAPQEHDADLHTRLLLLREARRRGAKGRWKRIAEMAAQYRRLAGKGVAEANEIPDPDVTGLLVASAYPERIAQRCGHSRYRLAGGSYVQLNDQDPLMAYDWLAVASAGNRIFLASPVSRETLEPMTSVVPTVYWDRHENRIVARSERRIGLLVLDARPLSEDVSQQRMEVLCEVVKREGASLLTLDEEAQRLQRRIAAVASWHEELSLPDLSSESVYAQADEWLPLYAASAWSAADLKRIDMRNVLWGMLSYEQQQAVERLAPSHIVVPTGSRIRVDYRQGAEAPVLSVRLQECFGLTDTPRVDDNRRPVLMELLSPGFKPVQLTQDLRSFWESTYFEVRKELRRRYPKHHWPDHPLEAEAVRGVKRIIWH